VVAKIEAEHWFRFNDRAGQIFAFFAGFEHGHVAGKYTHTAAGSIHQRLCVGQPRADEDDCGKR
jgi:hypothetical protein